MGGIGVIICPRHELRFHRANGLRRDYLPCRNLQRGNSRRTARLLRGRRRCRRHSGHFSATSTKDHHSSSSGDCGFFIGYLSDHVRCHQLESNTWRDGFLRVLPRMHGDRTDLFGDTASFESQATLAAPAEHTDWHSRRLRGGIPRRQPPVESRRQPRNLFCSGVFSVRTDR